ncbi:Abi family protein [Staphylococcus pseudintermedius]|nr:Abi family protein [Staphylococcus pseudintermedius]
MYEFDRYLSKQLYSLLNILEVHLRNLILEVYLIEIEDRELPPALFYLDKKIYFQKEGESYKITSKKRQNFNRLQAKFSNSVNQKKNDENIKHNLDKYGIIPAWVLFQKLSFGELAMFYTNTQTKNKKLVCKKIESLISENIGKEIKVPKEIFESWFNNIRYLRNKIAHTDVIYGVNFTKSCSGHASDKEYLNRLQKFHYQQRLITFLLAMQKLFMSMPEYCRDIWNSTIEDIQVRANENSSIKLARIGVLDNDMSYLKI